MTQDHSGRGRARLRLAAVLTALPLAASVVGGVAGAVPVAAATHVSATQAASFVTAGHSTPADRRHDDRDHNGRRGDGRGGDGRDHRGDCRDRNGGLLGLLADLLLGSDRGCI